MHWGLPNIPPWALAEQGQSGGAACQPLQPPWVLTALTHSQTKAPPPPTPALPASRQGLTAPERSHPKPLTAPPPLPPGGTHCGGTQRVKGSPSLPSMAPICFWASSGVEASALVVSASPSSPIQSAPLKVGST